MKSYAIGLLAAAGLAAGLGSAHHGLTSVGLMAVKSTYGRYRDRQDALTTTHS